MVRLPNSKRFKAFQRAIASNQTNFTRDPLPKASSGIVPPQNQRHLYEASINQSQNIPALVDGPISYQPHPSSAINANFVNKQRNILKPLHPNNPQERDNSGFLRPANPPPVMSVKEIHAEQEWNEFNILFEQFCQHPLLAYVEKLYYINKWNEHVQALIQKSQKKELASNFSEVNSNIERTCNWVRNSQPKPEPEVKSERNPIENISVNPSIQTRNLPAPGDGVDTPVRPSVKKLQKTPDFHKGIAGKMRSTKGILAISTPKRRYY